MLPTLANNPTVSGLQVQPSILTNQKSGSTDASQQQTKFVFNVETADKTSQSLQLLFQLPPVQDAVSIAAGPAKASTSGAQIQNLNIQNVATSTQTLSNIVQPQAPPPPQIQSLVNHQQNFLSFQLQQQQQLQQQNQQIQHQQLQQKQLISQAKNQIKNYTQVQVATQTQQQTPIAALHSNQVNESIASPPSTSSKPSNVAKKNIVSDKGSRKEKIRYGMRQAPTGQSGYQYDQTGGAVPAPYPNIPGSTSTGTTTGPDRTIDVDSETDSNHDTALTLACAGGHEELVDLLIKRGANIEHRDKKGFTPLILAATAGHEKVVEALINCGAELEAQSERTKDTPLSLACSGGRYEVVELLLKVGANKEHRNVSDYTPLSLAASGGYVNIIKLLLNNGAEINSRTGSKLGISPLMLAAMNGHTAAVRLLLDMGSDINAQIETNRNTALTLACFQGRHEVVSLLLDRKANVEHRAKTGLTPLMEAASGGYIEVGRVLLDKGADVNAAPVPSSRDTALTIAADKGHLKFVDLLLARSAAVEVKNKKGNSPLWLAANGGHLGVVEALFNSTADIDSQDNRKVSCLMAAFRKGHTKVVKWMVNNVTQFPSDQEMTRYISVVEKEVVDKCNECVRIIRAAKETQATKANINASILLKELDMEKSREESRKAAAAKRRERKKRRKQEKREAQRKLTEGDNISSGKSNKNNKKEDPDEDDDDSEVDSDQDDPDEEEEEEMEDPPEPVIEERHPIDIRYKEEGDSGIDANSQGSCSSSDVKTNKTVELNGKKNNKKKKVLPVQAATTSKTSSNRSSSSPAPVPTVSKVEVKTVKTKVSAEIRKEIPLTKIEAMKRDVKPAATEKENVAPKEVQAPLQTTVSSSATGPKGEKLEKKFEFSSSNSHYAHSSKSYNDVSGTAHSKVRVFASMRHAADREDYDNEYTYSNNGKVKNHKNVYHSEESKATSPTKQSQHSLTSNSNSIAQTLAAGKREEGWKEVVRKCSMPQTAATPEIGCKKIQVPLNAISRVIGRGGSNINAIRAATGAHIEVEKQGKTQGDRNITIKGVVEATKQAHNLISTLIKDPDADILSMLPRNNLPTASTASTKTVSSTITLPVINAWEKSVSAPVVAPIVSKTVTYSASNKSAVLVASASILPVKQPSSVTPTQLIPKTSRPPAAKSLFNSQGSVIRPTPTISSSHPAKNMMSENNKKGGMISASGPPQNATKSSISAVSSHATSSSIQALKNSIKNAPTATVVTTGAPSTFAAKLSSNLDAKAGTNNFPIGNSSQSSGPPKSLNVMQSPSKGEFYKNFIICRYLVLFKFLLLKEFQHHLRIATRISTMLES